MAAWGTLAIMVLGVPAKAGIAGLAMAEPAWGAPVPALSVAEELPKRLLEGLRIPEVTLDLVPKMPLRRVGLAPPFPVDGLKPTLPGTVVPIGLLGVGGLERFVVVAGWVGLAGAAPTGVGVLLTLGDGLGLGEAGRLAAGWVVRLPPSALLLLLCAEIGLTNNVKTKASAIPTCANFKFAVLYLPVNMADLLNYVQPLSL